MRKCKPTWLACSCTVVILLWLFSINFFAPSGKEIISKSISQNPISSGGPNTLKTIVSFKPRAGLCNIVCEYVHLLHANITFSMEAFIHPKMHQILSKLFESFPLPVLPASHLALMISHPVQYFEALSQLEAGSPLPPYTLLTGAPCRISTVWTIRQYWREKLVFKTALKEIAELRLGLLMKNNIHKWSIEKTKAIVGVHVRRGDFIEVLERRYGKKQLLPPTYYHSAFNYYRQRFGREVIFVVLTEKEIRPWCREFLSSPSDDVFVLDDAASAAQDVVQLSMFDHIIYSQGTFGLWGILLSNAQTVVYPDEASDRGLMRYSQHKALDLIKDKVPETEFVTVTF